MQPIAPNSSPSPEFWTFQSSDGTFGFRICRAQTGIYVERVQFRHGKGRVIQSIIFVDGRSFERWCDADSMRFEHPLVHANLRRHGNFLLDRDE